ncbi:hypothetical protein DFJ73DRAFT_931283 [Zopfochytrium polystomum]|nr:hypothetical protein DFJ73DRAFT_931283 [Zopfochytrium polystomum]
MDQQQHLREQQQSQHSLMAAAAPLPPQLQSSTAISFSPRGSTAGTSLRMPPSPSSAHLSPTSSITAISLKTSIVTPTTPPRRDTLVSTRRRSLAPSNNSKPLTTRPPQQEHLQPAASVVPSTEDADDMASAAAILAHLQQRMVSHSQQWRNASARSPSGSAESSGGGFVAESAGGDDGDGDGADGDDRWAGSGQSVASATEDGARFVEPADREVGGDGDAPGVIRSTGVRPESARGARRRARSAGPGLVAGLAGRRTARPGSPRARFDSVPFRETPPSHPLGLVASKSVPLRAAEAGGVADRQRKELNAKLAVDQCAPLMTKAEIETSRAGLKHLAVFPCTGSARGALTRSTDHTDLEWTSGEAQPEAGNNTARRSLQQRQPGSRNSAEQRRLQEHERILRNLRHETEVRLQFASTRPFAAPKAAPAHRQHRHRHQHDGSYRRKEPMHHTPNTRPNAGTKSLTATAVLSPPIIGPAIPASTLTHLARTRHFRANAQGVTNRTAFLRQMVVGAPPQGAVAKPRATKEVTVSGSASPSASVQRALGLSLAGSPSDVGRMLVVGDTHGRADGRVFLRKDGERNAFEATTVGVSSSYASTEGAIKPSEMVYHPVKRMRDMLATEKFTDTMSANLTSSRGAIGSSMIQKSEPTSLRSLPSYTVNTRFSANTEWSKQTKACVQAAPSSHFYIAEEERFSHSPWRDEQRERDQAMYENKVKHFVRDKNVSEVGDLLKAVRV